MTRIFMFLALLAMPGFLAACSSTQSASSSYNGKALSKKKIKTARKARSSKRKYAKRKSSKKKYAKKTSSKKRYAKRRSSRGSRSRYKRMIAKHARANGVPLKLAMAVVQVESAYRPRARGAAGEIGLMQLMPRTARHIGYKGSLKKLYNPDTNLRYGMKYLGKAYRLGGRTSCGAVLKYNAGHGAKRMNPISRRYCRRVAKIMRR